MKYNYNFGFDFSLKSINIYFIVLFVISVLSVLIYWLYKYLMKGCPCKKEGSKEGFKEKEKRWSNDLINRFTIYQNTMTDNIMKYNLEVLQKNAAPEEAETLLKTGYWPWSGTTKYIYMDSIWRQPIIKSNVNQALDYAMKTYNESAAKQLLSWKSKEGKFLLYGGKGTGKYDTIKCSSDENNTSSVVGVIKKNFTDDYIENSEPIADADIPVNMPGFNFVKGPCNPCVAIHNDYSCPFKLNVGGDDSVSPIWKNLWGI